MNTPTVESLLRAVRLRLWQARFVAAIRFALWGSAGLMSFVLVVIYLDAQAVRSENLVMAIAAFWALIVVVSGLLCPSAATCALWADRHLCGASAYSTLLEMRSNALTTPPTQAVLRLEQWAVSNVPQSQLLLTRRRNPVRLIRPLLCMLVTAALTSLVLTVPGRAPALRGDRAASAGLGDAALPTHQAAPPASNELARELANALQVAGPSNSTDPNSTHQSSKPGASQGAESSAASDEGRVGGPSKATTVAAQSVPGNTAALSPGSSQSAAAGAGSGRVAGESRDDRVDPGMSRALPGPLPLQRRELTALGTRAEKQADMSQLATFEDDLNHRPAGSRAAPVGAAATSPPATKVMPLTPTEAAYVQAWMKIKLER